jgi:hypothetical protein
MSSKLISSLLKKIRPENGVLKNDLTNKSRDEDVNELKSLYQIPIKESGHEMPHYQVFEDGWQQSDLLFLPMDNKYNYALVVVDIHSRKCDAEPITNKTSETVTKAFEKIYKRNILQFPTHMVCDSGSEFKGETRHYFKENGVEIRYAETNRHRQVAMVEAKNKVIGSTLHKLMALIEIKTKKESRKWTQYLPDLITAINKELPKPIENQLLDEPFYSPTIADTLPVGTRIRTKLDYPINIVNEKRLHGTFRSSDIRWSREIKEIDNVILRPGFPVMYRCTGEDFNRTRQEIQVVGPIEFV